MKPVVDGLAKRLGEAANVVTIDARSSEGAAVAARYGVRATPGIVVLAPDSGVVRRWSGRLVTGREIARAVRETVS